MLLGESGCGKTTTLKLINRLYLPTSGEVLLKVGRRRIGIRFSYGGARAT